jgi:chromate transporter
LRNRIMIALAGIAFIPIFFFNPFPIIIIAASVIGYLGARSGRRNSPRSNMAAARGNGGR